MMFSFTVKDKNKKIFNIYVRQILVTFRSYESAVFQNNVFGPSKILFLCYESNFTTNRPKTKT